MKGNAPSTLSAWWSLPDSSISTSTGRASPTYEVQVRDGIATALELKTGVEDIDSGHLPEATVSSFRRSGGRNWTESGSAAVWCGSAGAYSSASDAEAPRDLERQVSVRIGVTSRRLTISPRTDGH